MIMMNIHLNLFYEMKNLILLLSIILCTNVYSQIIPVTGANTAFNLTSGQVTTFHDPNGPGGNPCNTGPTPQGNYDNCSCFTRTRICAAPGEFLVVSFTEFSMWNTTSGWDWMKIYDGPNLTDPVLFDNSVTGPDNPMGDCGIGANVLDYCSTGQCLTFEFWATSVVNRAGWDANVSSVASVCGAMPVDFIAFDVTCDKFTWITETEVNNDYFTIYYSEDGEIWDYYRGYTGGGNLNTPAMYEFNDKIKDGYYKLTQTDFNGDETELDIQHLDCSDNSDTSKEEYYDIFFRKLDEVQTNGITIIVKENKAIKVFKLK